MGIAISGNNTTPLVDNNTANTGPINTSSPFSNVGLSYYSNAPGTAAPAGTANNNLPSPAQTPSFWSKLGSGIVDFAGSALNTVAYGTQNQAVMVNGQQVYRPGSVNLVQTFGQTVQPNSFGGALGTIGGNILNNYLYGNQQQTMVQNVVQPQPGAAAQNFTGAVGVGVGGTGVLNNGTVISGGVQATIPIGNGQMGQVINGTVYGPTGVPVGIYANGQYQQFPSQTQAPISYQMAPPQGSVPGKAGTPSSQMILPWDLINPPGSENWSQARRDAYQNALDQYATGSIGINELKGLATNLRMQQAANEFSILTANIQGQAKIFEIFERLAPRG